MSNEAYFQRVGKLQRVASAQTNLAGTGFTTSSFDVTAYDSFRIDVYHTWAAATHVLVYLEHSTDGGTTWLRVQSEAISGGTGTLSNYSWTKATGGASVNFSTTLANSGFTLCRLVFDSTLGTTDTDTVDVVPFCK